MVLINGACCVNRVEIFTVSRTERNQRGHGVIIIKFIVQLASINIQNYNFSDYTLGNATLHVDR